MSKQDEMREFRALVESHLARMIAVVGQRAPDADDQQRERVVQNALLIAWEQDQWAGLPWLDRWAKAVDGAVQLVEEWDGDVVDVYGVMDYLNAEPAPAAGPPRPPPRLDEGLKAELPELDFREPEKIAGAKECPPCWRCRYFDGWLPNGKVQLARSSDPDIQESMRRIDENKVKVALWIRSKGWENFEE